MAAIAAIVQVLATVGSAVHQQRVAKRAKKQTERAGRAAERRQTAQLQEEEGREERLRRRDLQRQRQRARAAGRAEKRPTILTGPLGIPATGGQTRGGQTLLGL